MVMFCISLRILSPRPMLSTMPKDQTSAGAGSSTTRSTKSGWTRSRRGRRVLRRSKATNTAIASSTSTTSTSAGANAAASDDQSLAQPPRSTKSRNRSFRRCFVLTWKRMNKSPRPRKSQRFSFIPPGFVLVSHPRERVQADEVVSVPNVDSGGMNV
ncbi:hypothetical protein PM082_010357 [Marasmius tenuissimus]|nr:hypothetical protein PM082_010357 [Marasmius tenuissimus]